MRGLESGACPSEPASGVDVDRTAVGLCRLDL